MGRLKIVSIHQPSYFSWIGLLNKIKHSDLFIVLDTVKMNKRAYQRRTMVRSRIGKSILLSVPIHSSEESLLGDLTIANEHNWRSRHFGIITECYNKTPYYKYYKEELKILFSHKWNKLIDICLVSLQFECKHLGIKTPFVLASSLNPQGYKTELNLDICRKVGADIYLSGVGSRDYMDLELFKKAEIEVKWQEFHHPTYPQVFTTNNFISGMSALDLIFNCGQNGGKYI